MRTPKVCNMTSPSTGNAVANQFMISAGDKTYFQSYNTIIAVRDHLRGTMTLDKYAWNYSVTTAKYRNQFLNETISDTRRKIKEGVYKMRDLNR